MKFDKHPNPISESAIEKIKEAIEIIEAAIESSYYDEDFNEFERGALQI
jgi:hypothetical protein